VLDPDASTTVTVVYTPVTPGAAEGLMRIESSAGNVDLPLNGVGAAVPVSIAVSPASLAYGPVQLGESREMELSIGNPSAGDLTVSDIRVSPGANVGFALSEPFASSVDVVPGGAFAVTLAFTPLEAGEVSGLVEIESNADEGLVTVPLSGSGETVPVAQLVVVPEAIAYGEVTVNDTQIQELTLRNEGTTSLTVEAITLTAGGGAGFAIVDGPSTAFEIVPGGEYIVMIALTPVAAGDLAGNLQITSNSVDQPTTAVPLIGAGMAQPIALISVEPADEVDFGNVETGQTRTASITLTNNGDADLTIDRISVSEGADVGFAIDGGPIENVVLAPGDSLEVTVTVTPEVVGSLTGLFQVQSNANNEPVVERPLIGTGTAVPLPVISVTPDQVNFGDVNMGDQVTADVQIENTGDADLIVTNVLITQGAASGFDVVGVPSAPPVLAPGVALTVTVVFAPAAPGPVTATLSVLSNASNGVERRVPLQGTGGGVSELTVSPLSIDFGNIAVGNSGTGEIRIENTGTAPLNVAPPVISGSTGEFAVDTAGPVVLEPGEVVVVTATFTPSQAGAANATVAISSNADETPDATVELRGEGGVALIDLQPPNLTFAPQEIGQSQTLSIDVTNNGTLALNLVSVSIDEPSFVLGAVPTSVAPGATETIEVTFMPDRDGDMGGVMTIDNNSANASQAVVNLSGTGTVPEGAGLLVGPRVLTFGDTAIHESISLSIAMRSVGTTALTLFSLQLGGANGFALAESPGLPLTLAPGESTTIAVAFSPDAPGSYLDQLRIDSDDASDPLTDVSINGMGVNAIAAPAGQPE
jgi:uncharacterized membrane protein